MWRSVLLGVVLAGVLAGCSLGGGSANGPHGGTPPALSEGQTSTNLEADAALRFEEGVHRARSRADLARVSCKAAGKRVTCSSPTKRGTAVITEVFRVTPTGLVPLCFRSFTGPPPKFGCFGWTAYAGGVGTLGKP
jgi:hypothetical protein